MRLKDLHVNKDANPYLPPTDKLKSEVSIETWYLSRMQRYRGDGGPTLASYLGTRWFAMKTLLAFLAAWVLLSGTPPRELGWLLIGYLFGNVSASLKTTLSLKRLWPIQEQIVDWSIVEQRLSD